MKDAFGGTYMLYVLMIFFVIYISFMTVAIGYAKAFRIKNHVVSILEKTAYSNDYEGAREEIEFYVGTVHYNYSGNDKITDDCNSRGGSLDIENGICIVKNCSEVDSDGVCMVDALYYYEVTSYFVIEAPFFNISLLAPIRGETKIINQ